MSLYMYIYFRKLIWIEFKDVRYGSMGIIYDTYVHICMID